MTCSYRTMHIPIEAKVKRTRPRPKILFSMANIVSPLQLPRSSPRGARNHPARVLDGTYLPAFQRPREARLMVPFGVSRITIRQALTIFKKEGV